MEKYLIEQIQIHFLHSNVAIQTQYNFTFSTLQHITLVLINKEMPLGLA
jgi:hypothetical protein